MFNVPIFLGVLAFWLSTISKHQTISKLVSWRFDWDQFQIHNVTDRRFSLMVIDHIVVKILFWRAKLQNLKANDYHAEVSVCRKKCLLLSGTMKQFYQSLQLFNLAKKNIWALPHLQRQTTTMRQFIKEIIESFRTCVDLKKVHNAWRTECLKKILAYFQPIRIEHSKPQNKSRKSQSRKINPGH